MGKRRRSRRVYPPSYCRPFVVILWGCNDGLCRRLAVPISVSGKDIRPSKNMALTSCFSSQSSWRLETNLLGGRVTLWSSANASEALRRFVSEGLACNGGWGISEVPAMGRSRKDVYGRASAVWVVEGSSIPISRNRDRSIITSPDIDQPAKVLSCGHRSPGGGENSYPLRRILRP
jgi:hypothetical protein